MGIKKLATFFLHAGYFAYNPEKTMLHYQKKLGEPFYLQLNPQHGVWVSGTPESAQALFTASIDTYAKLYPADAIETLLGPGSMILLTGQDHLEEKKCMSPALHGENMRFYGETIRQLTQDELSHWHPGHTYDLYATMKRITLDVILRTIFGVQETNELEQVRQKTVSFLNGYSLDLMFLPLLRNRFWFTWRRYIAARGEFDALLLKQINDCKRNPTKKCKDILSVLVNNVFPNGSEFKDANLLDECRTLLMAGHETSATALSWALYYSLSDPKIKTKLLTEVSKLHLDSPIEAILKLPYLTAVCEEVLRIHPSVPIIIRTLNQPFEFQGKLFNPGDSLALSITLLHSNPKIWEKPELFNPERFINKRYSSNEYAPFGGGARRCLGASFALYEMKIIFATLLLQTNITIETTKNNTPRLHGLTMGPKKIRIKVNSRLGLGPTYP